MEQALREKPLVVLIEDEDIIVKLLEQKLTRSGFDVKSAVDGVAGLELIHHHHPDLVLLDMLLPRLNGFGVLEKLKEEGLLPKLPIIIVSNSGQPIEIDRALEFGVRDYLVKVNFDPGVVVEKAKKVLELEAELPVLRRQKMEKDQKEKAPSQPTSAPVAETVSQAAPAAQESVKARGKASVLLVEDDFFLSELLGKKFEQQEYKVYRAFDAGEARRILEEGNPIDIIMLDLVLPGMDGFTFLAELKVSPSWKNIPVIILSNLGQKEEIQRGLDGGALDYVIKAHNAPDGIVAKVKALLEKEGKK